MVMSRLRLLVIATTLMAGAARADTVQASSTTMLIGRQDFRDGALQSAVPLYELVNVGESDMKTSFADSLELGLSSWGALDLADKRFWQNGAPVGSRATGDVNVAYAKADFLGKHLTLTIGRETVADGVARMVQLDGAELRLKLQIGR